MDNNDGTNSELSHPRSWWFKLIAILALSVILGIGLLAITIDSFLIPGGNETFKQLDKERKELKNMNKKNQDTLL